MRLAWDWVWEWHKTGYENGMRPGPDGNETGMRLGPGPWLSTWILASSLVSSSLSLSMASWDTVGAASRVIKMIDMLSRLPLYRHVSTTWGRKKDGEIETRCPGCYPGKTTNCWKQHQWWYRNYYTMIFLKWNRLNRNCPGCVYHIEIMNIILHLKDLWKLFMLNFSLFG